MVPWLCVILNCAHRCARILSPWIHRQSTRNTQKHLTWEPKPSKQHQSGSRNRCQNHEKTRLCYGCVFGRALEAPWVEKGQPVVLSPGPFWETFSIKIYKNAIEKSSQKTIAKKHGIYRKRLPKCSRIRCRSSSKIDAKTGIEKEQENRENSTFSERVEP